MSDKSAIRSGECDICSWPRVPDKRWDFAYCAWHNRLMQWWSDSYGADYYAHDGRYVLALIYHVRDSLRVTWIAHTFYALQQGGPFDFWPWDAISLWWCKQRGHRWPECVGVADGDKEDARRWFLWRCPRCGGQCSLPDGESSMRAFAEEVTYDSIYVGFRAPTSTDMNQETR